LDLAESTLVAAHSKSSLYCITNYLEAFRWWAMCGVIVRVAICGIFSTSFSSAAVEIINQYIATAISIISIIYATFVLSEPKLGLAIGASI
jgi:hypothetical protein